MNDNRDYQKEKNWLTLSVWMNWVFLLAIATNVLYMILYFYLKHNPTLNAYYFLILGGLVGGCWGIGIGEAYSFSMWAIHGNDFQRRYDWINEDKKVKHWIQAYPTEKSFLANLRLWKRRFILYSIVIFVIGFIIGFFKIY